MLTISMLGKGTIYIDHECISEKLSSKLEALIFLLVLNKNKNMSKEKIISYLWPDSDDDAAKSNLRFNLWNIRKTIPQNVDGEDFIIAGKDFCRINENYPHESDKTMLDNFNASQVDSIDELLKLRDLFKGDFLEGLYLKNCDDFNEMILFERVVCQNRQIEILERLIGLYEDQGRFEEELRILNEAAAIEPYNEQFALRTIQIYGRLGNRTAAINYYKNFDNVLRRNLNTSANDELKQLYRQLLETPCIPKHEPGNTDRAIKKRINVTLRGLKEVEYFALAELIDQITGTADRKYILGLEQAYLKDLSHIYAGFLPEEEKTDYGLRERLGPLPPVRIATGMIKLIDHISCRYDLNIKVVDLSSLDPVSQSVIRCLETRGYKNVTIRY